MPQQRDPSKAFPAEILALEKRGVPLPTWYAGPLYTGNGTSEAMAELNRVRESPDTTGLPAPEDDAAF